jgi:hypothetical protein
MANEIILDDRPITLKKFQLTQVDGLQRISAEFNVTSEEYHDVATLLYKGEFEVKVPAAQLSFRGKMVEYSTSVTNLYESGQVGLFRLVLLEVKE